jgi:hypothetical protein
MTSIKKGGALSGFYRLSKEGLKSAKGFFSDAVAVILESRLKWYGYGENDRLPNEILDAVNCSGTATACIERLTQFIQADGFISPIGQKKIGTLTWDELLSEISDNVSYFNAMALRVFYTNEMKIGKIETLPIQTVRIEAVNNEFLFHYNLLMGEIGYRMNENIIMHAYEPGMSFEMRSSRVNAQKEKYGKQVGEVYYVFRKRLGRLYNIYPIPSYYSGIEDIITDSKLSALELRNMSQGWRAPVIVSSGPVDDVTEDANGKTEQDYYDEALSEFIGEDAAPVLHLKGRTKEEMPQVTILNLAEMIDATDKASIRIPEKVARIMGVPKILIGMSTAGQLGNVQELENTMKLFALTVFSRQNMISSALQKLIPDLPAEYANETFEISNLDVFQIESQSSAGVQVDAGLSALTGRQYQQFMRILRNVKQGKIEREKGLELLKLSFGFNDEQCNKFLSDGTPAII